MKAKHGENMAISVTVLRNDEIASAAAVSGAIKPGKQRNHQ